MSVEVEITAGSVDEAIDIALEELGVEREDVDIDVLEDASKGFLGIGNRLARVRVTVRPEILGGVQVAAAGDTYGDDDGIDSDSPHDGAHGSADRFESESGAAVETSLDPSIAGSARAFTEELLSHMHIEGEVDAYVVADTLELTIDGDDMGLLIGRRGETLSALQVLVSGYASRIAGGRVFVSLDIQGYRERRRESLEDLADRISERVASSRKPYRMRPMSAADRRVVHMFVKEHPRVESTSEGVEPNRYVVIQPSR